MRSRTGLAIACVGAILAAACSDPPTTGSGQGGNVTRGDDGEVVLPDCPLEELEQAEGPVEVTFWYGGLGGPTRDTLLDMAARFNASQDKIVVTPSDQGASFQEVYRKVNQAAGADTSQLPQIFLAEDSTLQQVVDSGLVLPAEACMEADGYDMTNIEPVVRANYTVDGAFYPGFSFLTSQVLYYNKAHWSRAGLDPENPPETLDELYDAAVALKEAGVSERPLSFRVGQTPIRNWLTAVGVDMVDQENGRDGLATEASFDTAEAHDLVDFFRRMNDEGLLNVFSAAEGGVNQYLALVQQQSSMLIETSTASTTIAAALGGQLSAEDIGEDFDPGAVDLSQLVPGTGPFPGLEAPGRVVPGGGVLYITGTSDPAQQAASWEFLEFMLRPENGVRWHVNGGYLPMVKAVQDDPAVRTFWEQDLAGLLLSQAVEQLDEADPDEPGPLIGPYEPYREAVESAVESVLIDGADIDDSLAGAQAEVTTELERYAG
jgi:sn-glycerol 3-phosphate transport system substrate-binding protein